MGQVSDSHAGMRTAYPVGCIPVCRPAAKRRAEKAAAAKHAAEAALDASSTRMGELRTEEARTAEKPPELRKAGRGKRGDVTTDAKLRMMFDEGDALSGHQNSTARRFDCDPQTVRRIKEQTSETVLTQRDDSTHALIEAGADLFVADLVAPGPLS